MSQHPTPRGRNADDPRLQRCRRRRSHPRAARSVGPVHRPQVPRPRAADRQEATTARSGSSSRRTWSATTGVSIGRIGGVGARQGVVAADTMEYKDGKPGGFDPHRAHPRHGRRRHRRGVPVPEPRAVLRARSTIRSSPPRCAAPTTAGWPIIANPIPTGCSGSRCCRCRMSSWRSTKCVSRSKELGFQGGFLRPNPYHGKMINTRCTSRSGPPPRTSIFRSASTRARRAACRTVGVDRFEGRRREAHHLPYDGDDAGLPRGDLGRRLRAAPEDPHRFPRIGRRLDRAVARPHGSAFRRPGVQRLRV